MNNEFFSDNKAFFIHKEKYVDFHPWDLHIPNDFTKQLFYFKNPIYHSNSTFEVLGDYIYEKIQYVPERYQNYYMLKIVNISAHLTVLDKQADQICELWSDNL